MMNPTKAIIPIVESLVEEKNPFKLLQWLSKPAMFN
jgi:hypothetical protein